MKARPRVLSHSVEVRSKLFAAVDVVRFNRFRRAPSNRLRRSRSRSSERGLPWAVLALLREPSKRALANSRRAVATCSSEAIVIAQAHRPKLNSAASEPTAASLIR